MIRVCALEFLNRDSFESDVKLADGTVIISAGESVTPELILQLYFKEIYVDTPLSDFIPNAKKVVETISTDNVSSFDFSNGIPNLDESASASSEIVSSNTKGPVGPEISIEQTSGVSDPFGSKTSSKNPEPQAPDLAAKFQDYDFASNEENSKTPVAPTLDLGSDTTSNLGFENTEVPANTNIIHMEPSTISIANLKKHLDEETLKKPLQYDEKIAEEIKTNASMLAKELHFSTIEIEDLEKAALASQLGVEKFIHEDLFARDFEAKKAKASYDAAAKKGIYSNQVLEIIKCHARHYVTETFNLNNKIPLSDILFIAVTYSKYLYIGMKKEEAILKMLEYGGNQFNIFALHKFLRLMRENA